MEVMRRRRPPPASAPYLAEVPTIDDALAARLERPRPSAADVAAARIVVARLRQLIRQARRRFERATGRLIEPEPPLDR